jgi:hypothetical protein
VTSQDLELNCGIRSALTRHWIDLTKTNFFARRGHVHLSGQAAVVGAHRPPEATAVALRAFESELRRLKEVKSVTFEFTNWARDETGAWICLERKKEASDPQLAAGNADGQSADSAIARASASATGTDPRARPPGLDGTALAWTGPQEDSMSRVAPNARVHVGVYEGISQADRAVWELVHAGIPRERITVICPSCTHQEYEGLHKDQPSGSHTAAGAAAGGAIGALLGGLAAVIGITASGGMGLLVAGPLIFSSGTGAVFGGFVGAMMTRGMEREVADFYDQALEKGKVLLAVEVGDDVSSEQVATADRIFLDTGAETLTLKKT